MNNFQFLAAEFKPLFAPARAAEQLVHSDARACRSGRGNFARRGNPARTGSTHHHCQRRSSRRMPESPDC